MFFPAVMTLVVGWTTLVVPAPDVVVAVAYTHRARSPLLVVAVTVAVLLLRLRLPDVCSTFYLLVVDCYVYFIGWTL